MAMDTPFFDDASNYTGHEATPIPPLYDPQQVIDVLVKLATEPEDEIIVGAAGRITNVSHQIAPAMTEAFMAHQTHKKQIKQATPAPNSAGAVHQPTEIGNEVSAGRLSR